SIPSFGSTTFNPLLSRKNVWSPNNSFNFGTNGWSSGITWASNWVRVCSSCAGFSFMTHSIRLLCRASQWWSKRSWPFLRSDLNSRRRPEWLFVRRPNALKKFPPNFRIVSSQIQNRCVLFERETLIGHGLCKFTMGFRHNMLFLGVCFRFGNTLPITFLETYDAFERGRHCAELLIRQVRRGSRRTWRR